MQRVVTENDAVLWTANNPLRLKYKIVMIGLFALSFMLLQKERRKHLSPLDVRKDARQQRSTLLGGSGDKNAD
ncbi:hypothetical protein PINS_up019040 [Pythium insidiosum]|nr:hypothetical protein PINS_up019040 [Pythium insidiosum]